MSSRRSLTGSNSSLTPKVNNASPEVVFKMAKKIAQLTKVVYYLNTKQEDQEAEILFLTQDYDDQIHSVSWCHLVSFELDFSKKCGRIGKIICSIRRRTRNQCCP